MINMDAFDAYKIYIALKSHFNSDYDFNKYHGKTSVTLDSFLKRSDRSFFGRVGRKYKDDTKEFFISNFISDPKGWIGNFDDVTYVNWQKIQQSLKYTFETDLIYILRKGGDIEKVLNVKNGQHPLLLKQWLGNKVSTETIVIMESLFSFCNKWDRDIDEKILWPDCKKLIKNYSSVLTFDKEWYRINTIKLIKEYSDYEK